MARVRQARRCRARRRDGQPCRCFAITGGYVCRVHGGTLPRVRRKARERLIEADVYRSLARQLRDPRYRDFLEQSAAAADRAVIEAFAERLDRARLGGAAGERRQDPAVGEGVTDGLVAPVSQALTDWREFAELSAATADRRVLEMLAERLG